MPEYISFPVIGGDRVAVTLPDKAATLAEAEARLRDGRGFALATINLDHLTKLRRDRAFAEAYLAQDMVVADGNPIVWLSALAGKPTGLVPGSELVDPLAAICARIGAPLAMLGTTEAAFKAALAGSDEAAFATAVVVAYFAHKLAAYEEEWELVADKAKGWLQSSAGSKAAEIQAAADAYVQAL